MHDNLSYQSPRETPSEHPSTAHSMLIVERLCYALSSRARRQNMHINTKMRLAALLYLMAAYAVALPGLALFTDLMINGGIIDMWKGAYSFMDLLARRKILYLQFAGLGAILGFVYWLFFFRKYRHHDPLDKYFK
ncbi:hypothetical protein MMY93_13250 [Klebsiella michiganensis]|nr:hypothetical protein [Klebsiella michiganensis]UPI89792.1 hypothetical protein MMY93_13250 [Klebsiella michiganensis]